MDSVGESVEAPASTPQVIRLSHIISRPNGGTLIGIGWTGMAIGLTCLLVGLCMSSTLSDFTLSAPEINPWKWPLTWGGVAIVNLATLVLSVGAIIRAMFFLPGSDTIDLPQ